MAESKDILAALYDGLISAMDDVRQKVVEEPAYGRAVTEKHAPESAVPECCGTTLEDFYGTQMNIDTSSHEHDVEIDAGDIDRGR